MPSTRSSTDNNRSKSRSNSRANSAARTAILEMLKEDHKRAKKAFRAFEKIDPHEQADEAHALVMQTCGELKVHTALEEELLYPAAREALDAEDLIDEAEVEHASAKDLIEKLSSMQPGDEKYAAMFTVLGEYVKHHIGEEEKEMFPQLESAKLDWQDLQAQVEQRREQLMQEHLASDEDDDTEDEDEEEEEGTGFVKEKPDVQDEESLPEG